MPEELQQELRKPGGVLENEPSAAEKEKEKRKRSDGKKFIIWKDEKTKQLFLGEVKEEKRGRVTVQHYGSYGKGALRDRLYRPAVRRKGERAVMFTNNTKKYGAVEPDLFEVEREDIVIEDAEVEKNGRLELAKLMKYDTYDTVRKENVPTGATVLDMLVVDTLKMKAGGEREFKARAVARGDQDPRQGVETATCGCPPDSVRFVLLAALASPNYGKNSIASVDCQNAYLQAKLKSRVPVYVRPPPSHLDRKAGLLWRLKKALYGLKDAGRAFEDHLWEVLRKLDWELSLLSGVFWKKKGEKVVGLLSQYVDDLIIVSLEGDTQEMVQEIAKEVYCKEPEVLGRYVGSDYEVLSDGRI
uniref:Reverse transcriptase Ty1/copia-type domain-containing protein n=1 Tax=Chromera velia CCMP2878 TaxID=1169474 RepID=A0A0G4HK53_9ALVE|eukprot:Cvel_7185.t1-p1 / transcript=Cvel_7185.t1 / gene=Cvel_7185 / organism=Chromera_velia_CCMP2878 / gene_product=hypothetical protein / transcript_product=hypothetical protein / location=Cvel_scaffold369:77880-79205(+) / protein_length=357 / sequence_SO=supercontig / SO=protein_coding / is_pseudo=false